MSLVNLANIAALAITKGGGGNAEAIAGFQLLLEGDMQSGTDALLLEGDMQAGTDVLLLEGTN